MGSVLSPKCLRISITIKVEDFLSLLFLFFEVLYVFGLIFIHDESGWLYTVQTLERERMERADWFQRNSGKM